MGFHDRGDPLGNLEVKAGSEECDRVRVVAGSGVLVATRMLFR
jgi:hypothetical protein